MGEVGCGIGCEILSGRLTTRTACTRIGASPQTQCTDEFESQSIPLRPQTACLRRLRTPRAIHPVRRSLVPAPRRYARFLFVRLRAANTGLPDRAMAIHLAPLHRG